MGDGVFTQPSWASARRNCGRGSALEGKPWSIWGLKSVGRTPAEKYEAGGFNREIIRKLLVSSLQAQWDTHSCPNPYKTMQSRHVRWWLWAISTAAPNGWSGMCSLRSDCLYLRMGHISPEQRRPPQTSYGHVGDSIPIQIHDSMYGLTEELHLFTITACRDSLRARTGKQRERENFSWIHSSLKKCQKTQLLPPAQTSPSGTSYLRDRCRRLRGGRSPVVHRWPRHWTRPGWDLTPLR